MRRPAAVLVCALSACAVLPERVPVEGAAGAVRALAGEWHGEYDSRESGRSGSILFRIGAAGDTAAGDVVMVPRATDAGPERMAPPARAPMPLRIAFVQVSDAVVRGEMAPYADPDCGCRLLTVFTGVVRGDVIDGTFVTVHLDTGHRQSGRWRVTRAR